VQMPPKKDPTPLPDLGGPEAGPVSTRDDGSLQAFQPDFRNQARLLRTEGPKIRRHQGGLTLVQAALMLAHSGSGHAQACSGLIMMKFWCLRLRSCSTPFQLPGLILAPLPRQLTLLPNIGNFTRTYIIILSREA
jgi:hypothetical protein